MEFEPRPRLQFQEISTTRSSTAPIVRALALSRLGIPTYVWPTLFTALGGWLWGYDTGSIGPIIVMPQFEEQFGAISPTIQGLLVSSIIATAAVSSFGSGALSDRISRTYTIALGAFVFSVGCAISCSAKALPQLFIGRCITGFGQGLNYSLLTDLVPRIGLYISSIIVYVCEISPASKRGRAMTTVQLFNTLGVAAGYFTCFGTVKHAGSISWRLPLGMQAIVAMVLAIGTPFFPHSPHWMLSVGRPSDAEATAVKLGLQLTELRKEDEVAGSGPASRQTFMQQAKQLWGKDVRFRTSFGLFLLAMQQACGIDAVLYYAPILFQQAGLSTTTASFLASGVSGIVMVVLTAGIHPFQDKWPRRTQTILGGSIIAGCMLLMGGLYASDAAQTTAGKRTLIALIYIFIAAFIGTWAIVIRVIVSEIQPRRTRAAATSLAQCLSWVINWVIAFSTPLFLTRSKSGPYFMFGVCSVFTVVVCVVFQPETQGRSLDVPVEQGFEDTRVQAAVKGYFRSKSGESTTTSIQLVPVRTGNM
ncbi:general substrate transporter [Mycena maculata]|uniref:General substrate transporter n=1 Tax=Mycena maculata TaxID=230809 RepID=A0AAD7KGU9_9AGAR|nr:general substrate transporter [Mycena maculata]